MHEKLLLSRTSVIKSTISKATITSHENESAHSHKLPKVKVNLEDFCFHAIAFSPQHLCPAARMDVVRLQIPRLKDILSIFDTTSELQYPVSFLSNVLLSNPIEWFDLESSLSHHLTPGLILSQKGINFP